MSILVTGSLAYDHLLSFDGLFSDVILKDQLDNLSVCFYAPEKKLCFGGCAGNLAYNLKLLNADFLLYGRAGKDFGDYMLHFKKLKIATNLIKIHDDSYTATAYLTTDKNSKQVITFAPGVMLNKEKVNFHAFHKQISIAIIAPEDADYMISIREESKKYGIKYIFDPGQQLPTIDNNELKDFVDNSVVTIVNSYEWELLSRKLNIKKEDLLKNKQNFIITHGDQGSELIHDGKITNIKAFQASKVIDPTGCGDAYRAGVLYGISQNWSLEKSCELGAKLATKVVEQRGTQEHHI